MTKLPFLLKQYGELFISNNVAVVGSSSKLLEKEFGPEIDKHECVIRFNRAPTKGFEKYVGSKTDIVTMNPHVFSNRPYKDQCQKFIPNIRNVDILVIGPENKELLFEDHLVKIDGSCRAFKADIGQLYSGFSSQPTVGMALLKILVTANIVPNVYGFYGIPGKPESEGLTHYFENRDNVSRCHNYHAERQILKNLHKEGKIKWVN